MNKYSPILHNIQDNDTLVQFGSRASMSNNINSKSTVIN